MEFRRSLVASFLFRFFADAAVMLETEGSFSLEKGSFPDSIRSAVAKAHREPASGIQYFSKAQDGAVVGAPERHMAADLQVRHSIHALHSPKLFLPSHIVGQAHREPASGIQYFSKAQDSAVVGAPERHMAADLQVTSLLQCHSGLHAGADVFLSCHRESNCQQGHARPQQGVTSLVHGAAIKLHCTRSSAS